MTQMIRRNGPAEPPRTHGASRAAPSAPSTRPSPPQPDTFEQSDPRVAATPLVRRFNGQGAGGVGPRAVPGDAVFSAAVANAFAGLIGAVPGGAISVSSDGMSARIYGGSGRPGPRQPHDASNQPPSSASRRPVLADANLQVHGIGVGPPSSQPESAFYGPAGHSFGMYMGQAHGAGQAHGTRRGRGRTELLPQAAPMLSGPPASPLTFADLLRVAGDRATGRPALSNGEGVSAVVAETLSSQCSLAARIARFRANLPPPLGWVAFEVRHDETFEMPPGFAKDPSAWLAKWLVRYADGEKGTKVASRTPCCRRS